MGGGHRMRDAARLKYVHAIIQMSTARVHRSDPHKDTAWPPQPSHPGGSLAEALDARRREGRPVRVGLIGAGQMGTDILVQTAHMPGIEVVAAADAVSRHRLRRLQVAGDGPREPAPSTAPRGVAPRSRAAASRSRARYRDVCTAEASTSSSTPPAIRTSAPRSRSPPSPRGKHIVMMNVEADVTIGAYLSAEAAAAGVVYTLGAGDEPTSTMELVNFVRGLGYPVVAAGKGKNNRSASTRRPMPTSRRRSGAT